MAVKYANIFHCKTLQNFTQFGIFGLKINHLATLEDWRAIVCLASMKNKTENMAQRLGKQRSDHIEKPFIFFHSFLESSSAKDRKEYPTKIFRF
jgi:hypothetical protein